MNGIALMSDETLIRLRCILLSALDDVADPGMAAEGRDILAAIDAEFTSRGDTVSVPDLTPVDGGFRVKATATHYIDIIRMIYNWRLATVPKSCPMSYDRGWCYAGTGPQSFTRAVLAAMAWDGADGTEPEGWNKNIQTGEWREPEAGQEVPR